MFRSKSPNAGLASRAADRGSSRSLVAAGVLRDAEGKPLAGMKVRLDLEPNRAVTASPDASTVGMELAKLDEVATDSTGRFELDAAALGDMTGYADADGSASVMITAPNVLYHLTVQPDPTGQKPWVWHQKDSRVSDDSRVPATAQAAARGRGRGLGAIGLDLRERNANAAAPAGADERGLDGVNGANHCYSYETFYWVRNDSNKINTENRLQRVYIKGGITSWNFEWKNTEQTSQDAAANIGAGGALVSAGYTRVQTQESGVNLQRNSNTQMDARITMENRPFNLYCSYAGSQRYSGVYEWRAFDWTGGSNYGTLNTAIFNCDSGNTSFISGTSWVSRDKTTTMAFSVGTSLGGVNLRTATDMSNYYKMSYTPVYAGAYLCGNGGYYVNVAQARER